MKKGIWNNPYLHAAISAILLILLVVSLSKCHQEKGKVKDASVEIAHLKEEIDHLYIEREMVCREFIEIERGKFKKKIDSLAKLPKKWLPMPPEKVFIEKPVVIYKDNPYPKDSGVVLTVEEFSKIKSYQDSVSRYVIKVEEVVRQREEKIATLSMINDLSDKRIDDLNKSVMSLSKKVLTQEALLKKQKRRGNIKTAIGVVIGIFIGKI